MNFRSNFRSNFRRKIVRTNNEIRRIPLALLLHNTVRRQIKLIHKPQMKAYAKYDRVHAPHDTQMKLKMFRLSPLALNQIDNLDILLNSRELLILSMVNFCEFDNRNLHTSNTKRQYNSYTPESSKL